MDTDRRLRQALLPYQPRLLHDVLDGLDVAVVVLDETGRVLAANVAASALLGVHRGRRAGDAPPERVAVIEDSGAAVDVVDYAWWRALGTAGGTACIRVVRGTGERWLAATAEPYGEDAVVCRYTDVTARRELERRAVVAADKAARAEIDLVAAEQRVALLEELLVYLATGAAGPDV